MAPNLTLPTAASVSSSLMMSLAIDERGSSRQPALGTRKRESPTSVPHRGVLSQTSDFGREGAIRFHSGPVIPWKRCREADLNCQSGHRARGDGASTACGAVGSCSSSPSPPSTAASRPASLLLAHRSIGPLAIPMLMKRCRRLGCSTRSRRSSWPSRGRARRRRSTHHPSREPPPRPSSPPLLLTRHHRPMS